MSTRRSTAIWATRRDLTGCYVTPAVDDQVRIVVPYSQHSTGHFDVSRSEARLLAKRINQCLDATVKR